MLCVQDFTCRTIRHGRAALRCAALQNSANVAPLGAARLRLVILHRGEFFTSRDSSGYRDWPQSNAEKIRRRER